MLQYENGTVVVETAGVRDPVAKPLLRELARTLGVSLLNANGNARTTRQLEAEVIAALNARGTDLHPSQAGVERARMVE